LGTGFELFGETTLTLEHDEKPIDKLDTGCLVQSEPEAAAQLDPALQMQLLGAV
jgi:hypothetical protein